VKSQADRGRTRPPEDRETSIDQLRQKLVRGEPQHIVIASSEQAGYAMPAGRLGGAFRGDPVLFTGKDRVTRRDARRASGATPQSAV